MEQLMRMLEDIKLDVNRIGERLQLIEEHLSKTGFLESRIDLPTDMDRLSDQLGGLSAENGLQCLKDKWVQKQYLAAHCAYLSSGNSFSIACQKTRDTAPPRWERPGSMLYLGPHSEKPPPDKTMRESRLERAMFTRWSSPDSHPVTGAWHRLIKYQVPLKEKIKSPSRLKAIDLVGVMTDACPVVVEVKVMQLSPETPLRAILEAAAYGCVVQAAWKPRFKQELTQRLQAVSMPHDLPPEELSICRLVIAAPDDFWNFWSRHRHMKASAQVFKEFLTKASECGFPITFVQLTGADADWQEGLPHNWQDLRAEVITFP